MAANKSEEVEAWLKFYYDNISSPIGLIACNPDPRKAKFTETPFAFQDKGGIPDSHFELEHKCATPNCFFGHFRAKIKTVKDWNHYNNFDIEIDIFFKDYMITVNHQDMFLRVAFDEFPSEEEAVDEREREDDTPVEARNGYNWHGYRLFKCAYLGTVTDLWIREGYPTLRDHYPSADIVYQSLYDLIKAFLPRFIIQENPVVTLGIIQRSAKAQQKEHDIIAEYHEPDEL
jgi:hypothetical protein